MSTFQSDLNNGQQAISNYDLSKIFVFQNRYQVRSLNNSEYSPMTLLAGTVMGAIKGTGTSTAKPSVFPCVSTATDGSQYPIGILAADITIQDGVIGNVPICTMGDVIASKVIMWNAPTDTLSSVPNGGNKTYYDELNGLAIKMVDNTENSYLDNQ